MGPPTESMRSDLRVPLAVAAGSACGAGARWAVAWAFDVHPADAVGSDPTFPWHTLVVNVVGCLAIGLLAAGPAGQARPVVRAFTVTGLLGGFTTMSAFAVQVDGLAAAEQTGVVAAYVGASLGAGLVAVWLGAAVAARRSVPPS